MTFIPTNPEEERKRRIQLDDINKNLAKIVNHFEVINGETILDDEVTNNK